MSVTENPSKYQSLVEADANMKVGDKVWFLFTNCNRYRRVFVTIVKINAKSVIGEGVEQYITDLGTYPKGHRFKVPRITDIKGWTENNRVEYSEEKAQ